MPISVSKVGHIVRRVRDLDRSMSFYCGVLGLRDVARRDFGEGPMVFLSTGDSHHDIALVEAPPTGFARGEALQHFALKVGDSLQELATVKRDLDTDGGYGAHWARPSIEPRPKRLRPGRQPD